MTITGKSFKKNKDGSRLCCLILEGVPLYGWNKRADEMNKYNIGDNYLGSIPVCIKGDGTHAFHK